MELVYKSETKLVLRFQKGENYKDNLISLLEERGVESAWLNGLGGFLEAEVAFYDLEVSQEYITHKIEGPLEVASLTGNVATDDDGELVLHNHVVLGQEDYSAVAGHLVDGVVGGTLEVVVTILDNKDSGLRRTFQDEETGLTLLG